jgi:hypothetical protein
VNRQVVSLVHRVVSLIGGPSRPAHQESYSITLRARWELCHTREMYISDVDP